ncbi:ATP-binding protein [Aureibaculum luteum]|uniref:ATP-binding protein n=1 Tax=Aureibaculum luteum TaxID=1548456 RepID=UPI000E484842|nr:ATP-binding protein [Aureibaculum luteum]
MDFRVIISSTKSYKIVLAIAIAFLLMLSSISYRQINNLEKSADLVSTSLIIEKEINNLFSKFSLVEAAEYRALIVKDSIPSDTYKDYKREIEISLHNLTQLTKEVPEQQQYIDSTVQFKDSLHAIVTTLNKYRHHLLEASEEKVIEEVSALSTVVQRLKSFKLGMSKKREAIFKERMIAYKTETFFTPFISLLLALFSLIIFWLAFRKINNSRKKLVSAQAFVESIVTTSNNLITYFRPLRDDKGKVIDFIFEYASNKIEDITGTSAQDIVGQRLSEAYPSTFTNGISEMYINCLETGKSQQLTSHYTFNNEGKWLKSVASKLEEGVNVTTIDVTQEKERNEDLRNLNTSLFLKNAILNNAEVMAKIGSFSTYLENGETDMSDNLYTMLGCKPNDFEASFEKLSSFVHPEDKIKFEKSTSQNLKAKGITEANYRVITKNRKVKHFKSATLTIMEHGKEKMVGVLQDVTESIKKDKKLKKRNKELKRSNAELESFNRVVSHDLQEPLRKIQMFISLLSETEGTAFSDKSLTYFNKIDTSANRMQMLIKNLLSYSRIDSTHENFERIDLNKKLEKVQDNLSERLKETNVKIVKNELPIIKGIPFQMEQLFNNLISNAIKYRSRTGVAKILIDASKVYKDQIPFNFLKTSNSYYKIVVSDNGIGFDQENADKIFDIFERLHQKNEYSGTGIGLAICKKIVENHHGFINASSEPNKGSIFYIYLPA